MFKVAIGIDLEWPYEHHYDVVRGILDYGKEKNWECSTEPWLELADNIKEIKHIIHIYYYKELSIQ